MDDGTSVLVGNRRLTMLHTRGHAKHHFVVHDEASKSVFTGDAFGVGYVPEMRRHRTQPLSSEVQERLRLSPAAADFVFPSTSPIDFEGDEAHRAVDRIVATGAKRAYLTHFGVWEDIEEGARQMHLGIDVHICIAEEMRQMLTRMQGRSVSSDYPEVVALGRRRVEEYLRSELAKRGVAWTELVQELLETDIRLNADGLLAAILRPR